MVSKIENKAARWTEEKCSVCGGTIIVERIHKNGLDMGQIAKHAIVVPEDPAWAANPETEQEFLAQAASDQARRDLNKAQSDLGVILKKIGLAQGGTGWSEDGQHTVKIPKDPEVLKNQEALRTEVVRAVIEAEKHVAAAGGKYQELCAARLRRVNAWRAEHEREIQETLRKENSRKEREARGPIGALLGKILAH
jgi:hypothetical protein